MARKHSVSRILSAIVLACLLFMTFADALRISPSAAVGHSVTISVAPWAGAICESGGGRDEGAPPHRSGEHCALCALGRPVAASAVMILAVVMAPERPRSDPVHEAAADVAGDASPPGWSSSWSAQAPPALL